MLNASDFNPSSISRQVTGAAIGIAAVRAGSGPIFQDNDAEKLPGQQANVTDNRALWNRMTEAPPTQDQGSSLRQADS